MAKNKVRIGKILGAAFLGLLFLFLLGSVMLFFPRSALNGAGLVIMLVLMAVYSFLCQWGLSRGNAQALMDDWPLLLALNGIWLVMPIVAVFEGGFLRSLLVLIPGLGGAFAGAAVASRAARKRQGNSKPA
jgi:ABC-type transport system involved in cytochrome c biogenesis permease subunit